MVIKINGKKKFIKRFNELTISEYKKVIQSIHEERQFNVVKYLSIVNDIDYKEALNIRFNNFHLLNNFIGEPFFILGQTERQEGINYIEDVKPNFHFKYDGKYYDLRNMKLNRAGHRYLIEQEISKGKNLIDLYTFSLAVALCENYDYDHALKITEGLQSYLAIRVLSLGAFFFNNMTNSGGFGQRILRKIIRKLLT